MTIAERLIQKGFDEGFKESFKEGFKEVALEVAREIACRLRDMGWTPERIQEATGSIPFRRQVPISPYNSAPRSPP
ncbi:hypothetical protein [Escherichia coli]|uniref:hypothetical protein n=1 Tax=Escherichia coli TaxID=562 RepID=UPI00208FA0ED|nr:hypothetical protein [Escherichia coli]